MFAFNCTSADISDKLGQSDGRPFHLLESFFFRDGHWGCVDDLLVTAPEQSRPNNDIAFPY